MVNREVVEWIKSQPGRSEKELTAALNKQGYSSQEIQEAFQAIKKIPFSVSFTLLIGLGSIALVLAAIIILLSVVSGLILSYLLIILTGLLFGYYLHNLSKKLNASSRSEAIFAIFSPILSLILIFASLNILRNISTQLTLITQPGAELGLYSRFFMADFPHPLIFGLLFYLLANIFVIIRIVKTKEYSTLLWYLLGPTLFFVIWLVVDLFTAQVMF
ncbi:MAG: hypothetical protein ABIA37_03055 [Candidatus Woesearchaeota archaeon]